MYSIKKLAWGQHVPTHRVHIPLTSARQQEWQYLLRTTPNIESCFHLREKAMQEEFLPALFGEAIDDGEYRL